MDHVTPLVLELLERVLVRGAPADKSLKALFRRERALTAEERARVAKEGLGVIVLRGRLDFMLGGGAEPGALLAAFRSGLELAPERLPSEPRARLAVEESLPFWLAHLWCEAYGEEEARALARASNRPGPTFLRANRSKNERGELRALLAEEEISTLPTRLAPHGLELQERANLFGSRCWREGRFEVQDEGSQLIVELADAKPGMSVLDLCSGAGGKTLGLAAAMGNEGTIAAVDLDRARLTNLRARARRAGVTIATCHESIPELEFDLALVDAPCSSLGVLRRSPDARWRMSEERLAAFPDLQLELLGAAAAHLGRGRRLIYATCTLNPAENEGVVERFLAGHSRFRLGKMLRLFPHLHGTDGFFGAELLSRMSCDSDISLISKMADTNNKSMS